MAVMSELITMHRTVAKRRETVANAAENLSGTPATQRLPGAIERIDRASELHDLTPPPAASTAEASDIQTLDGVPR